MNLSNKTIKGINNDIELINKEIKKIIDNPKINFEVIHLQYISPTVGFYILPLDHKDGSLFYYKDLRSELENILDKNEYEAIPIYLHKYLKN